MESPQSLNGDNQLLEIIMGKLDIEIIQSETIIKFKHIIYKNIFIVTMVITYILVASKMADAICRKSRLKDGYPNKFGMESVIIYNDQVTLVTGLK